MGADALTALVNNITNVFTALGMFVTAGISLYTAIKQFQLHTKVDALTPQPPVQP